MKRHLTGPDHAGLAILGVLFGMLMLPAVAAADALVLKRVVLSSGGIGYFEYQTEVNGDAELTLDVPLDQVDDVLKSMVVLDDKGTVGSVTLAGREPLEQAFKDLPFDRDSLSSPASLLNALQGAEIEVGEPDAVEGRVLRAAPETVRLPEDRGTLTRHRVSVMTTAGVKQFVLEEAGAIRFKSAELQRNFERALSAIAAHRVKDRRTLVVSAQGQGRRTVRAGYVVAVPLWKSSYRAMLPITEAAGKARLQGWAMVDNLSGIDWSDVELTLVSGNPVTFRQAIYAAYFIERPQVPVEVAGRILPPVDSGSIGSVARAKENRALQENGASPRLQAAPSDSRFAGRAAAESADAAAQPPAEVFRGDIAPATAAAASEAMTQISFRVPSPVSVAHGNSVLLPIVDRELPADRLSLYQPETHARHPIAATRIINDSNTGLPPGVIALYQRSAEGALEFAGDARLGTLPASEERLLGFALDQKTQIDREIKSENRILRGKIDRGVLTITFQDSQTTVYRIRAPAQEDRTVVIEQPRITGWDLAEQQRKEARLTADHYRFEVKLAAGDERAFTVTLERERGQRMELSDVMGERLLIFASTGALSQPVRDALERLSTLRGTVQQYEIRLNRTLAEERAIAEDQQRIRQNLAQLRDQSDLRRRYIAKLDDQENELERLRTAQDAIRKELEGAQQELRDYIASLSV